MKHGIKFTLINTALIGGLYFGFIEGIDQAQNFALFAFWVLSLLIAFIVIVLCAATDEQEKKIRNDLGSRTKIFRRIGKLLMFGYAIFLAAYNHQILAGIYFIFSYMFYHILNRIDSGETK